MYLSFGSNVGDREENLRLAIRHLSRFARVTALSSLYETDPVGLVDQPVFLNVVCAACTDLSPREVLHAVKSIEAELGREARGHWGPREIDIDLLLYGDTIHQDAHLTVPHSEMINRDFVLTPLAEIAPDLAYPPSGLSIAELRNKLAHHDGVRRLGTLTLDQERGVR